MLKAALRPSRSSTSSSGERRPSAPGRWRWTMPGQGRDDLPGLPDRVRSRRARTMWTLWTMAQQTFQPVAAAQLSELPAVLVLAPEALPRKPARPARYEAPSPAARRYRPHFGRRSRSWRHCRGSAQPSVQGRCAYTLARCVLSASARPAHRMLQLRSGWSSRQVRRPTSQPTNRAPRPAARWFQPWTHAGLSRRRAPLPLKPALLAPEPCVSGQPFCERSADGSLGPSAEGLVIHEPLAPSSTLRLPPKIETSTDDYPSLGVAQR